MFQIIIPLFESVICSDYVHTGAGEMAHWLTVLASLAERSQHIMAISNSSSREPDTFFPLRVCTQTIYSHTKDACS